MESAKPRNKPLKRPTQARARFTVEAIFEAFVRILRQRGWSGVTTRAVALETGVAVGTLYDHFPSKEALLSGYVRHQLDLLLQRLEREVVLATGLYQHPLIKEAAVVALADADAGVRITAFLSSREPGRLSLIELKRFCAGHLPLYMIPDRFEWLEALPRTSTDKTDYQRLKELG